MPALPPRPAVRLKLPAFIPWPSAFFLITIGCLGITGQVVLLRELMAAYGGNELSAGVTVAAWILCEALGAGLAGHARSSFIVNRLSFLSALSVLCSLAAVPAAVLVRPLLGVLPGETLSIPLLLLGTLAVVLLPAASHGALFVTAAAIHARGTPNHGTGDARRATGVGSAYVWEGIGTAFAGLACFLLLNRLPSLAVMALFSLPLAAALPFCPSVFRLPNRVPRTALVSILLAVASISAFFAALPIERAAWGAAWRGQRIAAIANTPYGKVVRLERAGQQIILYDGLPAATVPTTEIEHIEELALLPMLCHPAPRRVLVLGQELAVPTALARFRPDIEVATVQIDPVLARTCLAALSSDSSLLPPLFSLTIADPISFLSTTRVTFDCIILTDAAPASLGASRLFTGEFYRLCRSRLAPGGILAAAEPGDPAGLSTDLVALISARQRALRAAFEHVLPVAADFPLLLASDRPVSVEPETLLLRLAQLSRSPKVLDSAYLASLLDPFRQETFAAQIENRPSRLDARLSSAAVPRELFLNMVRENRLVSPKFGALYEKLGGLSPRLLPILIALLLIVGVVGAFSGGRPFSRGFAILTSGFSGAAFSSLLIFIWQVQFGSVFSGVALLVATFMLGTVLGGILGTRSFLVHRSSFIVGGGPCRTARRFFVSDLVLAMCAAVALILMRGGPTGAFLVANGVAGACLGFQFAVAGSTVHRPSSIVSAPETAARRAGILTALDLLGGSIGGVLTALILVPVFGIGATALSAGAVKLVSSLVQLAGARPGSQP